MPALLPLALGAATLLPAAFAASPAENALFAWADKCPSTAMGAGLYAGFDHATVTIGERTVHRVRTRSEGAGATGTYTETLWMAAENCRAVGYVESGAKRGGVAPMPAGFVVAKEKGAPTPDEQATLLAWAGYAAWDPTRPDNAVATARLGPPAVGTTAVPELPGGKRVRVAGYTWRPGAPPTQVPAWRKTDTAPDGATCPCFEVVRPGEPVRTEHDGRVWLTYGGVAGPGIVLTVDTAGARWAVAPDLVSGGEGLDGAPPAPLARLVTVWRPVSRGATLLLHDPDPGATTIVQTDLPGPFRWTADGVAIGDHVVPTATLLDWTR